MDGSSVKATEMDYRVVAVLQKINYITKSRGLEFRRCFRAYDHRRTGKLTIAQFQRAIMDGYNLLQEEVDDLAAVFLENEFVNTRVLANTLDELEKEGSLTDEGNHIRRKVAMGNVSGPSNCRRVPGYSGSRHSEQRPVDAGVYDIDRVPGCDADFLSPLQKIILKQVVTKRIDLRERFSVYDPSRRGAVSRGVAKDVLNTLNLALDEHVGDLASLFELYTFGDRMGEFLFDYNAFVAALETSFTLKGEECDAYHEHTVAKAVRELPGSLLDQKRPASMESYNEQDVVRVEQSIFRQAQNLRRVELLPFFADFDKPKRTGFVTVHQFTRVMSFAGISVSRDECDILCRKYAPDDRFDYRKFCDNVFTFVDANANRPTNLEAPIPHVGVAELPRSVCEIVQRLRDIIISNRIDIEEHFAKFDRLRAGACELACAEKAFENAGIKLTSQEMSVLVQHYRAPRGGPVFGFGQMIWDLRRGDPVPVDHDYTPPAIVAAGKVAPVLDPAYAPRHPRTDMTDWFKGSRLLPKPGPNSPLWPGKPNDDPVAPRIAPKYLSDDWRTDRD